MNSHIPNDDSSVRAAEHFFSDDGVYPNNARLPLLVYQGAFMEPELNLPTYIEEVLAANHWGGTWRNGIYAYQHYHSTAHEVLGVYRGTARVQFGGDQGPVFQVTKGDVIVVPAGVAHKNVECSQDFGVIGGYPAGQQPDMRYGKPDERPRADRCIEQVPLPIRDPVYGVNGPLMKAWAVKMGR